MTETFAGGRYTLVRRIAQGGMGDVLLAKFPGDRTLGLSEGLVVIKRVLPDHPGRANQATMLREEGRVGLRLLHENLVETFFVDAHDGDPLLVMEFLSGRAMSHVLGQAKKRKEKIPVDVALAILRGAACGLHFAHTLTDHGRPLGFIHRDVSPANLFVTFDGRVKVIDFGVAKADDSEIKTSTGILKGKLGYMSPEHAHGAKLSPAADLWSLGVCFWETLCAERLFASASPSGTLQAIAEKPIPSPRVHRPELSERVEALCMNLLERNLDRRLRSGAELVHAIDAMPEAASLGRVDIGGWLSRNFPEEAEVGESEARKAARMRRRTPTPMGLVEGTATEGPSEEEAPTIVMGAVRLPSPAELFARQTVAADDDDDDEAGAGEAATVRMKLGEIPADPQEATTRPVLNAGGLLADADADAPAVTARAEPSLSARPEAVPMAPPVRPALVPPARSSPGAVAAPIGSPTSSAGSSSSSPPSPVAAATSDSAVSAPPVLTATATLPLIERPSSWVAVAFCTFGAIAVAMGLGFGYLAPARPLRGVAAYTDASGSFDIVVAHRDAPPGARAVDLAHPVLLVDGAPRELPPAELEERLVSSGVRARATLPTTMRGTVALLLPVMIAALGALALALALPPLVLARSKIRTAAQVIFLAAVVAGGALVLERGALSWPGLDAWKVVPRLSLGGGG